jgi:hypothetical protein
MMPNSDVDLSNFESLGANCEFGFLQRHHKIEESSAFRWTEILSVSALVNILNNRLQGMFELENIQPFNANMVLDTKFGIAWHSHIKSEIIDPKGAPAPTNFRFIQNFETINRLWQDQRQKIQYMSAKTLENCQRNSKIFVFKPTWMMRKAKEFTRDDAILISDALSGLGGNKLLVVTEAAGLHPPGAVEVVRPGLVHGYIDRFAPGANAGDVSTDMWMSICAQAHSVLN